MFCEREWEWLETTLCVSMSSGLRTENGVATHEWISDPVIRKPLFDRDWMWFLLAVTPLPPPAQSNTATNVGRRHYFLSLLPFFQPLLDIFKSQIPGWGILILSELETFMTLRVRDYRIGTGSSWGGEFKPLDFTSKSWAFQLPGNKKHPGAFSAVS